MPIGNFIRVTLEPESADDRTYGSRPFDWCAFIELFRSRASLQAEILTLRHQLNVLRRKSPQRLTFGGIDRLVFAGLYRDVRRKALKARR